MADGRPFPEGRPGGGRSIMTARLRGVSARSAALAGAAILALLSSPSPSGALPSHDAFDRRITEELTRQNPSAALAWTEANLARERDDHEKAARLYAKVAAMAPGFTHALRRQAGEELALGHRGRAVALAREAVAAEASPENMSALATVLARGQGDAHPPKADLDEASRLAQRAAAMAPSDFYIQAAFCQVALQAGDAAALKQGVGRLLLVAPNEDVTHQFAALQAAIEGRLDEAQAELRRARELGMPEERYQALSQVLTKARPASARLVPMVAWGGGAWLGGLVLLFALGAVLSRAVLSEAESLPSETTGRARGSGSLLRRAYALVLWLSCLYYYVSLPIVAVVVLAAGGGIVYAMLSVGRIPVKLLLIVVVVTLGTLWSILKSLFVRARDEDPGERLELRAHPRLRSLLVDVARRVGTRPVDSVYLTPGTDVAVMERGGLGKQLRGRAERCLILGVGVLDGLRIGPLKAVLAHEYGHFSNRDTAGGGFALSVRRSLITMAEGLARSGAAAWYNPAWLFLNGFYRVFLRVSQGASRLQEILADRWAAFTYGSRAFEEGLRHVIERSVRFGARANATLQEMVALRRPVANLYAHDPAESMPEAEVEKQVREVLNRAPSVYDSHPSPTERTRWVRALAATGTAASSDDANEAWTLFADRKAIEERMTAAVRAAVLRASARP
jgi:Zn-dependent protease with chaperone function